MALLMDNNWGYNPYGPYISGIITPLTTGRGPPCKEVYIYFYFFGKQRPAFFRRQRGFFITWYTTWNMEEVFKKYESYYEKKQWARKTDLRVSKAGFWGVVGVDIVLPPKSRLKNRELDCGDMAEFGCHGKFGCFFGTIGCIVILRYSKIIYCKKANYQVVELNKKRLLSHIPFT